LEISYSTMHESHHHKLLGAGARRDPGLNLTTFAAPGRVRAPVPTFSNPVPRRTRRKTFARHRKKVERLAIFKAYQAEQLAAAVRIVTSDAWHDVSDALENLRHTGDKIKLAVRARRNKTRDRAN
jgi:hypothetical protein